MASLPTTDYKIIRLSEEMLGDIKSLYKSAYNANVTESHLQKKYNTSFTGKQYIGYIAYSKENIPAAYYGVFPCYVQYQGEQILVAQSGDTMTAPDHQGKGLFVLLAKMTYELAQKEGMKFIFGFPNKNSKHGLFNKLNWIQRGYINTYSFKINSLPLTKAAKKFNLLDIYLSYAMQFLGTYLSKKIHFTNSILDSENGGLQHDKAFFEYKSYSENFILEIDGILVWVKLDGKLWIGDIDRTSIQQFNKLLKKLKNLCFYIGCTEIVFNLSPDSYWDLVLKENYSNSKILPIGYLNLNSDIDLGKIKFVGGDFDTF